MTCAIIGGGISGLGAAFMLQHHFPVTLYEKEPYLGGHARTITVQGQKDDIAVDTGFIVFNRRNYPWLSSLFDHVQVPVHDSDMSFGASLRGGKLEYGTQTLGAIFAQKRNLFSFRYLKMMRDVAIFFKKAPLYKNAPPTLTLGDCLRDMRLGGAFVDDFLLPMGGAIWSCPTQTMLSFPASTLIRFFDNHGLLSLNDQPQWLTVTGGSREYVRRMMQNFSGTIQYGGVSKVIRKNHGVEITDHTGDQKTYDRVIFACHADTTLSLLADVTAEESTVLSAFSYQNNRGTLHGDKTFMPKAKKAWASWVYKDTIVEEKKNPALHVSYWMNRLQGLDPQTLLIQTLNAPHDPESIYDRHDFSHPLFNAAAIQAQEKITDIQGHLSTWHVGAYQRYGFHEDGLWSAARVVQSMGVPIPWAPKDIISDKR